MISKKSRILVVDDDKEILESAKIGLENKGYGVIVAADVVPILRLYH